MSLIVNLEICTLAVPDDYHQYVNTFIATDQRPITIHITVTYNMANTAKVRSLHHVVVRYVATVAFTCSVFTKEGIS